MWDPPVSPRNAFLHDSHSATVLQGLQTGLGDGHRLTKNQIFCSSNSECSAPKQPHIGAQMPWGRLGLSWQWSGPRRQPDNRHKECFQAEVSKDQKRKLPSKHKSHMNSASRGDRTATPKKKNEKRRCWETCQVSDWVSRGKKTKLYFGSQRRKQSMETAFLLAKLQGPLSIFMLSFVCALKPKFRFLPCASSPLSFSWLPINPSVPFPFEEKQAHKATRHVLEGQRFRERRCRHQGPRIPQAHATVVGGFGS